MRLLDHAPHKMCQLANESKTALNWKVRLMFIPTPCPQFHVLVTQSETVGSKLNVDLPTHTLITASCT